MNHSFPHRMIAVPARILLALFTDPLATVAVVAFWAALAVVFWVSWLLIVRVEQWIARHVNQHHARQEQRAFEEITQHLGDVFPADIPSGAEYMPGVTQLGPATPPPVRPALKRRRMAGVRIPRRRARHATTSSSSDGSTR